MSGLFITLEGGDGAGKTTQSELLAGWLEERGREVVRTREPGGTTLGVELRKLLLHGESVNPRAEALLYAADRAQHIATIVRPALERDAVVVQDRYIDSSLAYQGAGRVLDLEDVRRISDWATEGLLPQLTVLLDISPEDAAARRVARGGSADRLESEKGDFHQKVRDGFRALAKEDVHRYLVVDATRPADELHAQIIGRVSTLLSR